MTPIEILHYLLHRFHDEFLTSKVWTHWDTLGFIVPFLILIAMRVARWAKERSEPTPKPRRSPCWLPKREWSNPERTTGKYWKN